MVTSPHLIGIETPIRRLVQLPPIVLILKPAVALVTVSVAVAGAAIVRVAAPPAKPVITESLIDTISPIRQDTPKRSLPISARPTLGLFETNSISTGQWRDRNEGDYDFALKPDQDWYISFYRFGDPSTGQQRSGDSFVPFYR